MTDQPTPQGVNLLKELLFERETRRLDEMSRKIEIQAQHALMRDTELSSRIDAVFERAGSEDRLQHSVAGIIDGALREAEVVKHEPLSRAIAPLVIRTIKFQLKESQDEMVDALYPITGRLVKSYVQSAINDMMVEINAKLGGGRPIKLAEQSAATGLTAGELALAEANKLRVEELFLVRRGSGELVAHWERPDRDATAPAAPADARAGGANRDVLISSYIGGIMSLSEEAFGATPGSFRTLSLGDNQRIFVRGSAAHLLAVRCSGSASAPVERVIDDVFVETLDRYQKVLAADGAGRPSAPGAAGGMQSQTDSEVQAILPKVSQSIEAQTAERQSALASQQIAAYAASGPNFRRLYLIVAALAVPFVAWGLWSAYQAFETSITESAAQNILQSTDDIKGVPPKIDVKRGGRALTLSGFVPTEALRDQILARLAQDVPQAEVRNQLGVLPAGSGPGEIAIAELRQELVKAQATAEIDRLVAQPVARTRRRLTAVRDSLQQLAAGAEPSKRGALDSIDRNLEAAAAAIDSTQSMLKGASHLDPNLAAPLGVAWLKLNSAESQLARLLGGPPNAGKVQSDAPRDIAQLADEVAISAERLSAAQLGLTQALALQSVPQRLSGVDATVAALAAREKLETLVRSSAIFFDNGLDFKDPAQSGEVLNQLARQLRETPALVLRVVGFTDEKGTQVTNTNLAQSRANRVAALLIERGAPPGQLVAIGRQTAKDLTRTSGAGNVNRRVEFEIGFPGEKGDQ